MIIYVDIDGTICTEIKQLPKEKKHYILHKPLHNRIAIINKLYDEGHTIVYWTARGTTWKGDWAELTKQQLKEWGAKYHELSIGNKPGFDMYICDKSFQADAWFKEKEIMLS